MTPKLARQDELIPYAIFRTHPENKKKLYIEQTGKCMICLEDFGIEDLDIDHDHDSGLVRGLLCVQCNSGLGMFKDKPKRLKRAIWYLLWNYSNR